MTAVLGMWVIEGVSSAVDQWFGAMADPASEVVSTALVAPHWSRRSSSGRRSGSCRRGCSRGWRPA